MDWYLEDGTKWDGATHRMPNGEVHTGKTHTSESRRVFRFSQLTEYAKGKANGSA